jgi:hypothetical protein
MLVTTGNESKEVRVGGKGVRRRCVLISQLFLDGICRRLKVVAMDVGANTLLCSTVPLSCDPDECVLAADIITHHSEHADYQLNRRVGATIRHQYQQCWLPGCGAPRLCSLVTHGGGDRPRLYLTTAISAHGAASGRDYVEVGRAFPLHPGLGISVAQLSHPM